MKVYNTSFSLATDERTEISDITKLVRDCVQQFAVTTGIALVNTLHTTCALFVNEFQSALIDDLRSLIEKIVPERDGYRQVFSAVFSDFYLFDRLLGLGAADLDRQAQRWLAELKLDRKVTVEHGALSTTALSTGQRKRLALLVAYLEDRPVYVFDEWAADQDPAYKAVFYERLLPDLKARGKTVLVITHDDRYFHVADRCIELDAGQLRSRHSAAGSAA